MLRTEIKVIRTKHATTRWADAHFEYRAYCTRCHTWCKLGRDFSWKAQHPAERAAEQHFTMHRFYDDEQPEVERFIVDLGWEMVTEFTNEDFAAGPAAIT